MISSIKDLTVKAVLKTSRETHSLVSNHQGKVVVVEVDMVVLSRATVLQDKLLHHFREVTTKALQGLHHHLRTSRDTIKARDLLCLRTKGHQVVTDKADLGTITKGHKEVTTKEGLGITVHRGMETMVLHLELEFQIPDLVRGMVDLDKSRIKHFHREIRGMQLETGTTIIQQANRDLTKEEDTRQ